jgi:hypothetical protein
MASESALAKAIKLAIADERRRVDSSTRRVTHANVPVQLDLTVLQTWAADIKDESFCVELKVRCRWQCPPEHAEEAIREGGDALDVDWEPEWFPHVTTAFTTARLHESKPTFVASQDGAITWITGDWVFSSRLHEAYDLHAFPFDVQVRTREDPTHAANPCSSSTLTSLTHLGSLCRTSTSGFA